MTPLGSDPQRVVFPRKPEHTHTSKRDGFLKRQENVVCKTGTFQSFIALCSGWCWESEKKLGEEQIGVISYDADGWGQRE